MTNDKSASDSLVEVGTLNDTIRVFRDPWVDGADYVLVDYRGNKVNEKLL